MAYFVKGPLARARAAFASQPLELVAFLRTTTLSASIADNKYRETIPELIKELPIFDTPEMKRKPKKKRKWKPKRDKYGFFVDEKAYLEQWWRGDDDHGSGLGSAEKMDAVIKRRTQRLRSRETFLQVVLILETVAVEVTAAKLPDTAQTDNESQNLDSQAEESQAASSEKKSRKKKELDLFALLDTLLDRLCIWYSIDIRPTPTNKPLNLHLSSPDSHLSNASSRHCDIPNIHDPMAIRESMRPMMMDVS